MKRLFITAVGTFLTVGVCPGATINFPNFPTSSGFTFNPGSPDPQIVSNQLQVTTLDQSGEVTAAWYNTPVFLNNGFTTTIQYRSTAAGTVGNAWAFMIENDPRGTGAVGGGGTAVGGITNSLAVEADYYQFGRGYYMLSCGTGPNIQNPNLSCALTNTPNPSTDGLIHTMVITYDAGTHGIRFNVDSGVEIGGTTLPADLGTYLGLSGGTGFVGFVGDNGYFTGDSDIVSWELSSNAPLTGIPEPATLGMVVLALAGFAVRRFFQSA